ncbi:MAG: hypothetical protein EPN38_06685 [Rhodanobacteraceae bacterium]|nr:MAG: hypothetical protein EPN38_06685 [Rhodanobacteraceae bacterium]
MGTATLLWGMVFSAIGAGYFIYGKRQTSIAAMLCGIALVVYPWFVTSAWLTVIIGVVLMAIPYLVR